MNNLHFGEWLCAQRMRREDCGWRDRVFRDMCTVQVEPDGLRFAAETAKWNDIREDLAYGGVRIILIAHLEQARIQIQVDIGFGDAVTPPAEGG